MTLCLHGLCIPHPFHLQKANLARFLPNRTTDCYGPHNLYSTAILPILPPPDSGDSTDNKPSHEPFDSRPIHCSQTSLPYFARYNVLSSPTSTYSILAAAVDLHLFQSSAHPSFTASSVLSSVELAHHRSSSSSLHSSSSVPFTATSGPRSSLQTLQWQEGSQHRTRSWCWAMVVSARLP